MAHKTDTDRSDHHLCHTGLNHPVFKRLSKVNTAVNDMSEAQLQQELFKLNLEVRSADRVGLFLR